MFLGKYIKSRCINGCLIFNDNSNFLYWENKNVTKDEIDITSFLNSKFKKNKISLLHVGVGNSYIALNLKNFNKIDGISISGNEINNANRLKIKNYNTVFVNKFDKDVFISKNYTKYDVIVDVNLKSFCCCEKSFNKLMQDYSIMLNKGGFIATGIDGMNWSRFVKPVIRFSFKRFFYKRLKEYDGPKSNLLTTSNLKDIGENLNLSLFKDKNSNVVTLNKN